MMHARGLPLEQGSTRRVLVAGGPETDASEANAATTTVVIGERTAYASFSGSPGRDAEAGSRRGARRRLRSVRAATNGDYPNKGLTRKICKYVQARRLCALGERFEDPEDLPWFPRQRPRGARGGDHAKRAFPGVVHLEVVEPEDLGYR